MFQQQLLLEENQAAVLTNKVLCFPEVSPSVLDHAVGQPEALITLVTFIRFLSGVEAHVDL